ncbi:MAG: HDOD domain-containing protein [Actinomycetota bacterium]
MSSTVLFVDDEEEVLAGLRLSLRRHRNDYRFLFASSADDAIAMLDAEPVDMVVSDMRMPDRNGADLLEEVRFRHPDVIRYVLSGQAGDRLVGRSVAVTHRWLSKPCDSAVLIAAIAEATGHRAEILDEQVRRAVGAVDALPSHPTVHAKLLAEFDGGDASVERVAELAAGDPAFTVKLLQWANSAYASDEPIYDVRRAVERIGLDALGPLAQANDIVRPFTSSEVIPGFGIDLFHRHARATSAIAAGLTVPTQADLAAAGGLLSNVGLLVEVSHLRSRLDQAYRLAETGHLVLHRSEQATFGTSGTELASHLLALWGLPGILVGIVGESHGLPDLDSAFPLSPINAVRAARLLAQRLPLAKAIGGPHLEPVDDAIDEVLDRWVAELRQPVRELITDPSLNGTANR